MTPKTEELDAVVIGANIRGLVTAHVLDSLGFRAVVIERAKRPGGADSSFVTAAGTTFDHGLHVLDEMRSPAATRLFTRIVRGEVQRTRLARGIVLRNQIMGYAADPSELPEQLRNMLPPGPLVDELGDAPPSRNNLAKYYGREFTDLVFDEVLSSYPSESRHRELGVDEARLLNNIYPWFFPRAERHPKTGDTSRAFHDRLRSGVAQTVLYPKVGGFGGFAEGFLRSYDPNRIEILTGAGDLEVETRPGTHTVESVSARGRRFRADNYFWATGWAGLCEFLGIPCQNTATDRVMLGSFRFDRDPHTKFHELLVGDPAHQANRIYFPGCFRPSKQPLMQVEYAVPTSSNPSADPEHWRSEWLRSARRLGLIDETHRAEEFDFKSFDMHFNSFGMEGEALRDADASLVQSLNLHPVVPSMANLNLNAYVPRVIDQVTRVLTRPTD